MIRQAKIFMLIMFICIVSVSLANSAQLDLNTILMRSTFKIARSKNSVPPSLLESQFLATLRNIIMFW